MDKQRNGKALYRSLLPDKYSIENKNTSFRIVTKTHLPNQYDNGEFNGWNSVDSFIEKYKDESLSNKCKTYSNQNLNRSKGEHALFHPHTRFTHNIQSFYNYVEPQNLTTSSIKNNHVSVINRNVASPNQIINDKIVPKVTFIEQKSSINTNMEVHKQTGLTSKIKHFADKTTYCRPVLSNELYNEQFIYKTMKRNSKLKQLVKKLAIARQLENENVSWNNFINDLKNKHGSSYNALRSTHPLLEHEQYISPIFSNDNDNSRTSWQQSRPCRHLLQDFYEGSNQPTQLDRQPCEYKKQEYFNHRSLPYYNTHSYCYPTSSQGRLIMLQRERRRSENQRHYRLRKNNFKYENNNRDEKYTKRYIAGKHHLTNFYSFNQNNKNRTNNCFNSKCIQSNNYLHENICTNKTTYDPKKVLIDKLIQTFESENSVEEKQEVDAPIMKKISLVNIENKIEILISCINNFMNEIKSNNEYKRKANAASVIFNTNNNKYEQTNLTNDTIGNFGPLRKEELLCSGLFNDDSESSLSISKFYPCAKPSETNDIHTKTHKFGSTENTHSLKSQPCSVNITFEVPTRDCSTEVTKSLSKPNSGDKLERIEEISTPESKPMQMITIAVNTDPFNLLTLLRISAEVVMRLLSNVSNINYHSYLALLPFLQTTKRVESHYICNICGAAFNKPSALSDHIEEHNLGNTRNCCMCRHALDMTRTPSRLFRCKFCGQRFNRAYCCELHQQRCAQRFGKIHDVASSLMLLK